MKNNLLYRIGKKMRHKSIFVSLFISALILNGKEAFSQGENKSGDKISVSMNLSCKVSDGTKKLKVQLTRKENKKPVPVEDLTSLINLYFSEVKAYNSADGTGLISKLDLSSEGEGFFELPADFNKLTSNLHKYTFIAKMDSDPKYKDAESEITFSDARISIAYSGKDSIKTATATFTAWKDSAYVPVAGVELKLGIKRTFSLFSFGEGGTVTDKNGSVSADLPLDIPGNHGGTITVVAKVEDNETYGTLEATKDVPWAVLPKENEIRGRTLWSEGDNAPLILVISSLTIITVIWGTIFYLISLLIKIKKIGNEKSA